jgi:NTP pyrophosphatase (non-canonical NTP hydrolase)
MHFKDLREANIQRCEQSYHPVREWSPPEWLMCATGELGELAGAMKLRRRGQHVPDEVIAHEIADVIIYLDLLAASLGIDLEEAVRRKFNIVSDRVGSSIKL